MKALFAEGSNGTVYFDGESLTVTKTGLWNKLTGNSGKTTIPVELVGRIDWMPPRLSKGAGFILFVRSDDPMAEVRYRNYGRRDDYATANADPLGCAFTRNQVENFVEIRNAVRDRMHVDVVDVSNDPDDFIEAAQPMDFTMGEGDQIEDDETHEGETRETEEALGTADTHESSGEATEVLESLSGAAGDSSSYSEQLRMLTKLLRDGILTVEEFEAKLRLLDEKN